MFLHADNVIVGSYISTPHVTTRCDLLVLE